MKIRRCVSVAAVIVAVCSVAFLCRQRPSVEANGTVLSTAAPLAKAMGPVAAASLPPAVASASNQTATVRGTKPYVLTCERNFNSRLRRAAEALGVRTVGVLSRKSLLVEADAAALARIAADRRFAVEDEFQPSEKIAPALAAEIAGGAKTVDVTFLTLSEEDRGVVQGRIAARGGEVLKGCLNAGDSFSARLPASLVAELASCGDVRWMERFVRPHLMNDRAVDAEAMNVRDVWRTLENPGGLSGTNQIVSTSDSGIDTGDLETMHADLRAHVLDMKAAKTGEGEDCDLFDSNGHGTHTAGSIVGDGTLSQDATDYPNGPIRGSAWAAKLCVWFCGKDGTRSIYTPESCEELFRGDTEGTAWDAYIHSASWGSDTAGEYTVQCREFDDYLWKNPDFLPVVSAGNAGSGSKTVGSPAAAKNVLAVGATLNRPKGDPVMTASFSSRGPCADGRIKPDIASPGDSVTSTRSTMVAGDKTPYEPYTSMSGTSMSCPLTAGAVALMREWLVDRMGFSNAPPTAALMKAVITGGAKDAATPGNEQGWGRTDLAETLFPSNRAVKLIDRIPFADGDEFAWIVETKEDAPLDVQLAWVDYPGVASGDQSAPRLINDLDLTVSPLQGDELHYGNGRDEPDSLNNIESVRLASVGKGRYLVTVSCKDIVWDHTEGGAAALYIRGAFDPDEVVERYTVRIVKSPETTNTYARLDKALNEAEDGDVIEILDETELRESVVLTNDFALTVVATNANPRASVIGRRKSADILVRKGSLTFTNVAFRTENTTPVRVAGDGVVRVAGIAVFDDIVSGTPGVLTDRPEGFELVGVLENGITVDCTGASAAGAQFGVYRCAAAAAAESARRMISSYGKRRAGVAEGADGSGILKWEDDAPVDPAVAVGYVNGSKKVYYRTLDDLFDEHPSGTKVVVTKSGIVLEKPRTLSGVRSISAEAGAGEIVIFPGASAGFTLGAGCALSVSGITFRDYVGNGLFVVNGEGAKLDVANSVFLDIEGTNKWSGAITVRKGKAIVRDSTFDNCQATGQYRGNKTVKSHGGAIYLAGAGCELELKGGLITGCFAKTYGGGVYAAGGSSVGVRGALTVRGNWSGNNKANDDIHLQNTNAVLTLTGKLEGEDAVGVRYGASGLDKGNDIGKRFAAVSNGVDRETAISSEKAFFNDTDPVGIRADIDEDSANLLWAKRTDGDRWVDPEDPDAAVRVTKGCVTHYYIEPEYAFGWIDADAAVELLRNVDFGDDLVVTNGVKVTMVSKNDGPFTLSRSSDVLIRVLSGASLAISNLTISGNAAVGSSGLIKVRGGSLDLRAGVTIRDVWGAADRASSAISVQTNGTVTLRSGARVVDCMNGYVNRGSKAGYGGGLLVEDHSTANLLGGSIVECCANRGGGVFIGTKSEIGISGDVRIADNLGALGDDNLCVSDLSQAKVTLTGPLTGAIGYNEGRSGDTNVFGKVASSFDGTDADKQASAHRFTHDFTGDVGMAVSDGSETLLVWGNALDENGKYGEYELLDGDPYAVAVPVGHVREYDGTCQTGVDEGVGYMVVSGNAATNIGAYTAIVTTRPGFAWTDGSTGDANVAWSITRARYVLTGVTLEDRTFVYDGTYKTLEITGALPDGLSVKYENNVRWQPGTNDVTACISGSIPNYEPDPFVTNLYAKLIIIDPEGLFKGEDNPPGPIPTVVTNWPTPIAFQSITRFADTNWVLVVTNRVPWCWYRLIYTDDLAAGFTKTGRWERVTAEDGQVWTTNVIFSAEESAPAFFWRAEGAWGIVGQEPGIDPDHR